MDAQLRQSVRTRAVYQCEYWRLPQEFFELRFHIERVIPRQQGSGDDADNLALACPDCNLRKGPNLTGIDSETGEVVRLFHPRRDVPCKRSARVLKHETLKSLLTQTTRSGHLICSEAVLRYSETGRWAKGPR